MGSDRDGQGHPHVLAARAAVPCARAIAVALALLASCSANAVAGPIKLTATFARGATLGAATVLDAELHVAPRRAPATEVRVYYPASLGILSSGLGLVACRRPASDFVTVLITAPRLGGCSPNAVMADGSARADVQLSDGQVIREFATVALLSGAVVNGRIGLVFFVEGVRPFGARLVYAGELRPAPAPFGGALVAHLPAIPSLAGTATVALTDMRLAIGSHTIVYRARTGKRYRPEGVALPSRCPRGGFRFRGEVAFADGARAVAETVVRCPPPAGSM